jgi:hypothetical protein
MSMAHLLASVRRRWNRWWASWPPAGRWSPGRSSCLGGRCGRSTTTRPPFGRQAGLDPLGALQAVLHHRDHLGGLGEHLLDAAPHHDADLAGQGVGGGDDRRGLVRIGRPDPLLGEHRFADPDHRVGLELGPLDVLPEDAGELGLGARQPWPAGRHHRAPTGQVLERRQPHDAFLAGGVGVHHVGGGAGQHDELVVVAVLDQLDLVRRLAFGRPQPPAVSG